nr:MAG TPA: hypothetical protein [Caudoviricetes sp.]
MFFIVLDLRLTKDWLSGIDSLFLCSFFCLFLCIHIASLSHQYSYPIPSVYRHYNEWIASICFKPLPCY